MNNSQITFRIKGQEKITRQLFVLYCVNHIELPKYDFRLQYRQLRVWTRQKFLLTGTTVPPHGHVSKVTVVISSSHSEQGYTSGGEREGTMQMSGGKKRPFDLLSRSDRLDAPFFVQKVCLYVETRSMRAPSIVRPFQHSYTLSQWASFCLKMESNK